MRAVTAGLLLLALTAPASARNIRRKKQLARSQFETAERMREELNGRPPSERSKRDFQRVTDAFRRVYYTAPTSNKADSAVLAVAELLAEAGRQFDDAKSLQASIGQYEFLRREYPGSKYRFDALFTIGQIYKEDLNDSARAKATFEEFLKHYPRHHLAAEAKSAIAELDRPPEKKKKEAEAARPERKGGPLPLVTGIRHWSTPDYTRIAIDLEAEVQYEAGRISNPDRIFFDLHGTKLASVLVGKTFDVEDGFLHKIRVAQYQPGLTRVVLEVDGVSEFSAFLLPNPYRLIVDIHGKHPQRTQMQAKKEPAKHEEETAPKSKGIAGTRETALPARTADGTTAPLKPERAEAPAAVSKEAPAYSSSKDTTLNASGSPRAGAKAAKPAGTSEGSSASAAPHKIAPELSERKASAPEVSGIKPKVINDGDRKAERKAEDATATTTVAKLNPPEVKATSKPTSAPTFESVEPRSKPPVAKGKRRRASTTAAGHAARPDAQGERTLIRALGLKIGKIVVDAGHGGHDTGTIGPDGLQEKDLVLDVALRLGKLLETKMGADVVYTRDDDTFIPLETRTAIANQNQADLFISIHANSSSDPAARGVETYYLNFTSSPDALEVAARENAVSEKSIHELQDLVKKIALKEKIDESREFASDVQQSLYAGLARKNRAIRNRGVKKAPFVVLIGANMPSILAEISFLSNPTDERRLETPEYRQKIAEYLYRGIARYVGGLSGVKVASKNTGEPTAAR